MFPFVLRCPVAPLLIRSLRNLRDRYHPSTEFTNRRAARNYNGAFESKDGASADTEKRRGILYSLTATGLNTGAWVDVDALDFVAPTTTGAVGSLDGRAAADRTAVTGVVTGISIPPAARFRIQWVDFNASSAD